MADDITKKRRKDEKEFYYFCYDQYKIELEDADKLYQKASIIFVLLPILVGITCKLGRIDLFSVELLGRLDVCAYYLAIVASWALLAISIY